MAEEDMIQDMDAIVTAHEAPLLRYATGLLHDLHAAQDVVQNTFIKLFQKWEPGMRPTEALRPWLYRVTHNEAIDYLRREKRIRFLHERQAREQAGEKGEGTAGRLESVLAAARKLDPVEQQVLLLRLQEGLSYHEISRITGRSEGNVGCILHHAVKKLSRLIHRDGDGRAEGGQP